jgi:hypothetical protein
LLIAELRRRGIIIRKPAIYHRVGIPGSGGPDWLRNDYEHIVCASRGGPLPWSDNTSMGKKPVYEPGGDPSHRTQSGERVNQDPGYATMEERCNEGPHRSRGAAGRAYEPPEIANPGNVITCSVGGGNMGDKLCHQNEAPFGEYLAEFFIRSFCPPGGTVCDCFCGSGTTAKVALALGRKFRGCDLRPSQVELTRRRIALAGPDRARLAGMAAAKLAGVVRAPTALEAAKLASGKLSARERQELISWLVPELVAAGS